MSNQTLTGLTHCRVCSKAFSGPSIALIGVPQQQGKLAQYLGTLANHMREHMAVFQLIEMRVAEFRGLQLLRQYRTTDEELKDQRDKLRWAVHQETINARVSTATLESKTAELAERILAALTEPTAPTDAASQKDIIAREILPIVTFLRDQLEEPDKYELTKPVLVQSPPGAGKMTH